MDAWLGRENVSRLRFRGRLHFSTPLLCRGEVEHIQARTTEAGTGYVGSRAGYFFDQFAIRRIPPGHPKTTPEGRPEKSLRIHGQAIGTPHRLIDFQSNPAVADISTGPIVIKGEDTTGSGIRPVESLLIGRPT